MVLKHFRNERVSKKKSLPGGVYISLKRGMYSSSESNDQGVYPPPKDVDVASDAASLLSTENWAYISLKGGMYSSSESKEGGLYPPRKDVAVVSDAASLLSMENCSDMTESLAIDTTSLLSTENCDVRIVTATASQRNHIVFYHNWVYNRSKRIFV